MEVDQYLPENTHHTTHTGVVKGPGVDLGRGEGPEVEGPGIELKPVEGLGVPTEGLGGEGSMNCF